MSVMLRVSYAECFYAKCFYAECFYAEFFMPSATYMLFMLSGIMLNVVRLSVVAPLLDRASGKEKNGLF